MGVSRGTGKRGKADWVMGKKDPQEEDSLMNKSTSSAIAMFRISKLPNDSNKKKTVNNHPMANGMTNGMKNEIIDGMKNGMTDVMINTMKHPAYSLEDSKMKNIGSIISLLKSKQSRHADVNVSMDCSVGGEDWGHYHYKMEDDETRVVNNRIRRAFNQGKLIKTPPKYTCN